MIPTAASWYSRRCTERDTFRRIRISKGNITPLPDIESFVESTVSFTNTVDIVPTSTYDRSGPSLNDLRCIK